MFFFLLFKMFILDLKELLQVCWLLVAQVEEAVAGVVGVEPHLGTAGILAAPGTQLERLLAPDTELKLALGN